MAKPAALVVAAGAVGAQVVGVVWLMGMRDKDSAVVAAQRRINKRFPNPGQMRTAGTHGADASVIRHVGRTSGRSYETPVGAIPVDDGFVVSLVYGRRSDWVKNVLAGGSASIVRDDREYEVTQPELIAFEEAAPWLAGGDQRSLRLVGVHDFLRVHTAR